MNFNMTQQQLLGYLKENKIWKNLLPVAELLLIVCSGLEVANNFIILGSVMLPIVSLLRWVSIVLVLAKANYKVLTIGLGMLTLNSILQLLLGVIARPHRIMFSYILWACVYGLFMLSAMKKSGMTVKELKSTITSKEGIKNTMNLDEAKKFNINDMTENIKSASQNVVDQAKDIKEQVQNIQGKENE